MFQSVVWSFYNERQLSYILHPMHISDGRVFQRVTHEPDVQIVFHPDSENDRDLQQYLQLQFGMNV